MAGPDAATSRCRERIAGVRYEKPKQWDARPAGSRTRGRSTVLSAIPAPHAKPWQTVTERSPKRPAEHEKTKGLARLHVLTLVIGGAAGRIRTHDPLVRSQVLYPTELQPREPRSIAAPRGYAAAAAARKQSAAREASSSCSAMAASCSQASRRASGASVASCAASSSSWRALPHSWRAAKARPTA